MTIEIGQHLASAIPAIAMASVAIVVALVAGIAYIANHSQTIALGIAEVIDAIRGKRGE